MMAGKMILVVDDQNITMTDAVWHTLVAARSDIDRYRHYQASPRWQGIPRESCL
jgi:hypothetical protein